VPVHTAALERVRAALTNARQRIRRPRRILIGRLFSQPLPGRRRIGLRPDCQYAPRRRIVQASNRSRRQHGRISPNSCSGRWTQSYPRTRRRPPGASGILPHELASRVILPTMGNAANCLRKWRIAAAGASGAPRVRFRSRDASARNAGATGSGCSRMPRTLGS
jgi:hypothetical protein